MKKLTSVMLVLGIVAIGFGQKATKPTDLEAMVATELAFAKMAKDEGTRQAFMAFIADDGILFRPGPVNGKKWMTEHPAPTSDKRPLLSWYPSIAHISNAGDMGYTTGPWEFREDLHNEKASAFGNFLTVWKKQPDGSFKFVIDLGISNPQPETVPVPWQLENNHSRMPQDGVGPARNPKAEIEALRQREREFSRGSAALGAQPAFERYTHREVRMFRNNRQPMAKADATSALGASPMIWTWEPTFVDVARSNDLGYSYGTYKIVSKDSSAKILEHGNYYRIWKRDGAKWLVVTDLLDPVADK